MRFQFQGGAVRRAAQSSQSFLSYCFNSKVVRLEESYQKISLNTESGFNSKVVRLEVVEAQADAPPTAMFQFQGGAVRSSERRFDNLYRGLFQFQGGAVRSSTKWRTKTRFFRVSIPRWCG